MSSRGYSPPGDPNALNWADIVEWAKKDGNLAKTRGGGNEMTTYEKDEIIREPLKTIEGLRAENKDLKEKREKLELHTKPTRTMGGRTFVRNPRNSDNPF